MQKKFYNTLLFAGTLAAAAISCDNNDDDGPSLNDKIKFESKSVTPSLVKAMPGFEDLEIFPLIGSEDKLSGSPDFLFSAQPDGAGLMKDPDGDGYILINNHEIHFSVSRVYLDETFTPVRGEYLVDFAGGGMRLCSATLATPEEHGFGPVFLTAGETSPESLVHAIDPVGAANPSNNSRTKQALGRGSMENALPLPKAAYPGKTVILIGEDQSYTASHQSAGQVIMYIGSTMGNLDNGKLYALKRVDENITETNIQLNQEVDVQFVEIQNHPTESLTGAEINTRNINNKALRFSRVEDLDYRKGSAENNREIYFTATGQAVGGTNPEPGYTMWGRVYRLKLDANNPLTGKLTLVIEGDSQPGTGIINPDNICVTENFVYTQEDGDSYYPAAQHDSHIWQYNIKTKDNKAWLTMDQKRTDATFNTKYNPANETRFGSWEYGAMHDISDIIGVPETFLVNIHPHTWKDASFTRSFLNPANTEGGQVVIVRGVQK